MTDEPLDLTHLSDDELSPVEFWKSEAERFWLEARQDAASAGGLMRERDALLAEVKRLRAQLARRAGTRDQLPPGVVACARCGDPTISQLPWPPQTAGNAEVEVCTRCYDAIDVELTQPEETP